MIDAVPFLIGLTEIWQNEAAKAMLLNPGSNDLKSEPVAPMPASSSSPLPPQTAAVSELIVSLIPRHLAYTPFPAQAEEGRLTKMFSFLSKKSQASTITNPFKEVLTSFTRTNIAPGRAQSLNKPLFNLMSALDGRDSTSEKRMDLLRELTDNIHQVASAGPLAESETRYLVNLTATLVGKQVTSDNYLTQLKAYVAARESEASPAPRAPGMR